MFTSKIIKEQNETYLEFLGRTSLAFGGSSPATHYGEKNIAIYDDDQMVAGITLIPYKNILMDSALTKHFEVNRAIPAVKMTRLWRIPSRKKDSLIELFKSTYNQIDQHCYLYGILTLPLSFVDKRSDFFKDHLNLVSPHKHYTEADWDHKIKPSSNGQSLLNIYLNFGAELLGAPAACTEDQSVRVALGMLANEIKMHEFLKKVHS